MKVFFLIFCIIIFSVELYDCSEFDFDDIDSDDIDSIKVYQLNGSSKELIKVIVNKSKIEKLVKNINSSSYIITKVPPKFYIELIGISKKYSFLVYRDSALIKYDGRAYKLEQKLNF